MGDDTDIGASKKAEKDKQAHNPNRKHKEKKIKEESEKTSPVESISSSSRTSPANEDAKSTSSTKSKETKRKANYDEPADTNGMQGHMRVLLSAAATATATANNNNSGDYDDEPTSKKSRKDSASVEGKSQPLSRRMEKTAAQLLTTNDGEPSSISPPSSVKTPTTSTASTSGMASLLAAVEQKSGDKEQSKKSKKYLPKDMKSLLNNHKDNTVGRTIRSKQLNSDESSKFSGKSGKGNEYGGEAKRKKLMQDNQIIYQKFGIVLNADKSGGGIDISDVGTRVVARPGGVLTTSDPIRPAKNSSSRGTMHIGSSSRQSKDESGGPRVPPRTMGPCACCQCVVTPLWRKGYRGSILCNACGVRWLKYKMVCSKCEYIPRKREVLEGLCRMCGSPFTSCNTAQTIKPSTGGGSFGKDDNLSSQAPGGNNGKLGNQLRQQPTYNKQTGNANIPPGTHAYGNPLHMQQQAYSQPPPGHHPGYHPQQQYMVWYPPSMPPPQQHAQSSPMMQQSSQQGGDPQQLQQQQQQQPGTSNIQPHPQVIYGYGGGHPMQMASPYMHPHVMAGMRPPPHGMAGVPTMTQAQPPQQMHPHHPQLQQQQQPSGRQAPPGTTGAGHDQQQNQLQPQQQQHQQWMVPQHHVKYSSVAVSYGPPG